MTKKDKTELHNDQLKNILSGTKINAGGNLKYRIMQQIETEKTLYRQKVKPKNKILINNTLSIFGIMYILIAVVLIGNYINHEINAMDFMKFTIPVLLIATVCNMFWMISIFDEQRKNKKK